MVLTSNQLYLLNLYFLTFVYVENDTLMEFLLIYRIKWTHWIQIERFWSLDMWKSLSLKLLHAEMNNRFFCHQSLSFEICQSSLEFTPTFNLSQPSSFPLSYHKSRPDLVCTLSWSLLTHEFNLQSSLDASHRCQVRPYYYFTKHVQNWGRWSVCKLLLKKRLAWVNELSEHIQSVWNTTN